MNLTVAMALALLVAQRSEIKSDEVVVFYPTYAFRNADGGWNLRIHGVIFEPEAGSIVRAQLVKFLARKMHVEPGTAEARRFEGRIRQFLVDHERGKRIHVHIGSQVHTIGPSAPNGHFEGEVTLSDEQMRALAGGQPETKWITWHALTRPGDERRFAGRAQIIGGEGLSVISDIDDTIKHTEVRDAERALANTFVREFEAVPGMAGGYQKEADRGAVFHYVSASPWQLYRPLAQWLAADKFPPGSVHLALFRLTDSSSLVLLDQPDEGKRAAIERILADFPKRRIVLVGDTGQKDPELYGEIARRHGDQIARIFLRNVTGEKADDERFKKAFREIDSKRWVLFTAAEQFGRAMADLANPL